MNLNDVSRGMRIETSCGKPGGTVEGVAGGSLALKGFSGEPRYVPLTWIARIDPVNKVVYLNKDISELNRGWSDAPIASN